MFRKKQKWLRIVVISALCLIIWGGSMLACIAQEEYPTKSIHLYVPFGPGGATDLAARALVSVIPAYLGQPVIVHNMPGAGGTICDQFVLKQKPDGYTMQMAAIAANLTVLAFNPDLPFSYNDFTLICRTQASPGVVAVASDTPWDTLEELLEYIRNNPGKATHSSSGIGSMHHLGAWLLLKAAGIPIENVTLIPFDSGAEQVTAILGGHIDFAYINYIEVISQIRAGKMKLLAVTPERLKEFPNVPTFKELGYPGVNVIGWRGIVGPPGLSDYIVNKWVEAIEKVKQDRAWLKLIDRLGEVVWYQGPEEFAKSLVKEYEEAREIAKLAGR